jgi:hypothetical protein
LWLAAHIPLDHCAHHLQTDGRGGRHAVTVNGGWTCLFSLGRANNESGLGTVYVFERIGN